MSYAVHEHLQAFKGTVIPFKYETYANIRTIVVGCGRNESSATHVGNWSDPDNLFITLNILTSASKRQNHQYKK